MGGEAKGKEQYGMGKRAVRRDQEAMLAAGKTICDVLKPSLWVVFCGINPGLYSAITGHHFARPGNRFWPTLYRAGFTDRLLTPPEEQELLSFGLGITNLVSRTTATAAELTPEEIVQGGQILAAKVQHYQPQVLAILGVSAYRTAFNRPKAQIGRQSHHLGATQIWVLPNPSGLNAHYTPAALAEVFREFRQALLDEIGPYQG